MRINVCGLKWGRDGELLASSCDDGTITVWDCRVGDVKPGARSVARWTNRDHGTAVKALAWCPWDRSLLTSGGGRPDGKVRVWNTDSGERVQTLDVRDASQITSIPWSLHQKEFMFLLGYRHSDILAYRYPTMEKVLDFPNALDSRILWSALGLSGDIACTGGGDGNLKFWKIWEAPRQRESGNISR